MPRETPVITVTAHPPERECRPWTAPSVAGAGCCCCCCCCLHSVGALIWAMAATSGKPAARVRTQEADDYADEPLPDPASPGVSLAAGRVFWHSTLAVVIAVIGVTAVWTLPHIDRGMVAGVVLLALGCPGVLLIAALLSAFVLAVSSEPTKGEQIGHVGRIAIAIVAGTLAGLVPMACFLPVLR